MKIIKGHKVKTFHRALNRKYKRFKPRTVGDAKGQHKSEVYRLKNDR